MAGSTHPANPEEIIPVYFTDEYIRVHGNNNILKFKNNYFIYVTYLTEGVAYSFNKSPFGSFLINQPADFQQFKKFEEETTEVLRNRGISKIMIRQPPKYYSSFVDPEWLMETGYKLIGTDVNQFIELNEHPENALHKMEIRKLRQTEKHGLLFSHDPVSALNEIHAFIAASRKDAGLTINISLEKLKELFDTFPADYSIYSVRQDNEILSACIVSRPVEDIYYYYLPATHPKHRHKSPMVLLIVSLLELLQSRGARILDLGLSSIQGKKQKGLYDFKRRMGALETHSQVFEKAIS